MVIFPFSIGNLTKLTSLVLGRNELTGPIPSWLANLTQLNTLWLPCNKLCGPIPASISSLLNLQILDLYSNNLSGTIEFDLFRKLNNLSILDLSNNNLSLVIDPSTNFTFQKFKVNAFPWRSLQILFLSNNKLQGALPIPPPSIFYYSVSNNTLTGDISQMICEISSLSYLDVSHNNLSGFLPHCLGDLRNLSILNLITTTFMAAFLKYS